MMAKAEKTVLDFALSEISLLEQAVILISSGTGWINVTPGVPTEVGEEGGSLFSWLSGARPQIAPLATWMPALDGSGKPGSMGVLHGRGRLHRDGIAKLHLPEGWIVKQDHARRGLLINVGLSSPERVARTMIDLVDALAMVETTGRYFAEVFRRSY